MPLLGLKLVINEHFCYIRRVVYFLWLAICLLFLVYIAAIYYVVDERVGIEDCEDPGDFVEPGKQPFDQLKKLLPHVI